MRFKGQPNLTVIIQPKRFEKFKRKAIGRFDQNGYMDVENPVYIKRMLEKGYKEVPLEEKPLEPKGITCKTCGEVFMNRGDFLAHCRAHKAVKT